MYDGSSRDKFVPPFGDTKRVKISDSLNQMLTIIDWDEVDYFGNKSVHILVNDGLGEFVVTTSSKVVMEQLEKYGQDLPKIVRMESRQSKTGHQYYSLANA